MQKAHYNTLFHCECGGSLNPSECRKTNQSCPSCREACMDIPHPCPHCDGEARYLRFSPEDREKFLQEVYKDPVDLSFLSPLGFDKEDAKTIERCMNAMGPVTSYWKVAHALNTQLSLLHLAARNKRREKLQEIYAMDAAKIIHDTQKEMENYQSERAKILRTLADLDTAIQNCTKEKTRAEKTYAEYLVNKLHA
jgi:hypothetical protein